MCKKNFIFLGIFGMGMAPLAIYITQQGHNVYGWDDDENETMAVLLEKNGVIILSGKHIPANIHQVVYSSAIKPDHHLLNHARSNNIETIRRGIFLSEIAKNKKLVAVIGSHGKSSSTALLTYLLKEHHIPCSYIIGALPRDHSLPANFDKSSDFLICEVDESDGTIENFTPHITLALNFDDDHMINYGSFENMQKAIFRLFSQTSGAVIVPQNDETLAKLATSSNHQPLKFHTDHNSFIPSNLSAIITTF
jgi:UDP-N-acetylmuramate-alanine ligase